MSAALEAVIRISSLGASAVAFSACAYAAISTRRAGKAIRAAHARRLGYEEQTIWFWQVSAFASRGYGVTWRVFQRSPGSWLPALHDRIRPRANRSLPDDAPILQEDGSLVVGMYVITEDGVGCVVPELHLSRRRIDPSSPGVPLLRRLMGMVRSVSLLPGRRASK